LKSFAETAPSNVQEAAKATIVNIMGSLPSFALDAALLTTSTKLANILFQMQLTGYMFKNAEYRMSFTKALKGQTIQTFDYPIRISFTFNRLGLPQYASRSIIQNKNQTFVPSEKVSRYDINLRNVNNQNVRELMK
jgi:hypothetical protein